MAGGFDREIDLLVAGAGPSGMAAALVGALEGLDVLLCEKSEQVGGTAATSAGTLWIPGNHQSRDAGYSDSASAARLYMDSLVGTRADLRRLDAYLATGPEAIDYYTTRSDVRFVPCGRHPDYHSNRPGAAVSGRAIVPEPFDGRLLGRDFERVRPPIREFMILGGMMVGKDDIARLIGRFRSASNFLHSTGLFARYLMDRLRYSRGTRVVMGNALVSRLFLSLRRAKVPLLFGTGIVDLVRDNGAVIGAVVQAPEGTIRVRARRGVVLATGGFAHNQRLRQLFMPEPTPSRSLAPLGNTGDGMLLGEAIGARIKPDDNPGGGFWTPVSVTTRRDGGKGLFPHLSLDRAKPGLLAVNSSGYRFVNEGNSYHDFVLAMFESNKVVPSIPAWLVCSIHFIRKYGLGAIHPGTTRLRSFERNGDLTTAPTLDELARKVGIDPAGLRETARRNDAFAAMGIDADFGKGETELNRFNGDPRVHPNPCLGRLGKGPFCAMAVWPAEIACSIGLSTNEDAEVLSEAGTPIPGLYACGNDMASIMAGSYPGPGTTLGPALVFAYRAAKHAAGSRPSAG